MAVLYAVLNIAVAGDVDQRKLHPPIQRGNRHAQRTALARAAHKEPIPIDKRQGFKEIQRFDAIHIDRTVIIFILIQHALAVQVRDHAAVGIVCAVAGDAALLAAVDGEHRTAEHRKGHMIRRRAAAAGKAMILHHGGIFFLLEHGRHDEPAVDAGFVETAIRYVVYVHRRDGVVDLFNLCLQRHGMGLLQRFCPEFVKVRPLSQFR